MTAPLLHMLCGKIASGKSTLAASLSRDPGTILLAEDAWLGDLYGDEIRTGADFMRYSGRLRRVLAPHVVMLLRAGLSVVLDFQANTVEARAWMRSIADEAGADHRLHVLEADDALCLSRLKARNAAGAHAFAATEAQFHAFTRHYAEPGADEGFTVVRHPQA